jgi:MFS transporter, putative metabolite:H+ symporter
MLSTMALSEQSIAARIERLPQSPWHLRMRVIIGTATFFDAFDSVTIATVLPTLVALWNLSPQQVGWLIAIGFAGQAFGALFVGWLAERIGRIPSAVSSIAIFAVMSILCAMATSYDQLLWFRAMQGFGLGGEVPIAATYINEIAKSHKRGRFFLLYECVFLVGILVCSIVGAYVVPRFGYQWMFLMGGIPALLTIALRRWCPESPRWLASRGRLAEADRVLAGIECEIAKHRELPAVDQASVAARPHGKTRWAELFEGQYLKRTLVVWVIWFSSYLFTYGLITWLPTIYRTIYEVSVQDALIYGVISTSAGLVGGLVCALLIDRTGRKSWMSTAFVLAALPALVIALLDHPSLTTVIVLAGWASVSITSITLTLYLYTPEIYPTRMRALGTSWATFWPRFSSFTGAWLIGMIIPHYGASGVFLLFAVVAIVGAIVCMMGATETRGQVLEEISP